MVKGGYELFDKLKQKAEAILSDNSKLDKLVQDAQAKAKANKEKLENVWQDLLTLLRILKLWVTREYTIIPWRSLLLITFAVLYFVVPTDFIPDFIFSIGLVDDITLIAMVVKSVKDDIDKFIQWENEQKDSTEA